MNLPIVEFLCAAQGILQGPVAYAVGVIGIAATGIGWALVREASWVKTGLLVMFSVSVALLAAKYIDFLKPGASCV